MNKFEKFAWDLWKYLSNGHARTTDGTYVLVAKPGEEPFALRNEGGEWIMTPSLVALDNMQEVAEVTNKVVAKQGELRPCRVPGCLIGITYGYFCNPHLDALPFDLRKQLRQEIKEHGSLSAQDIEKAVAAIVKNNYSDINKERIGNITRDGRS